MTKLLKLDFLYSENQRGGAFNFLNPSSATSVYSTDTPSVVVPTVPNDPLSSVSADYIEPGSTAPAAAAPSMDSFTEPVSAPALPVDSFTAPSLDSFAEPASAPAPPSMDSFAEPVSAPAPLVDSFTAPSLDSFAESAPALSVGSLSELAPPADSFAELASPTDSFAELASPTDSFAEPASAPAPPVDSFAAPAPSLDSFSQLSDVESNLPETSNSSTMGSIPLPSSTETPTMDLIQSNYSTIEPTTSNSTIVEPQSDMFLEPSIDNNLYSNDLSPEISSDPTTLWGKIKGAFKWTFTSIFSFPTLIVIFIIILTVVLIFIYNLYKNNSIKLPQSIERFIVSIKTFFTTTYNKILNKNNKSKDKKTSDKKYFDSTSSEDADETNKKSNESILNKNTKEEVFNIDKNLFTYEEAEHVCKKFNSKLATEDQVKKAWENGANWCNYGWSQGKKALYPIQKEFYNKLKLSNSKNKNQCGYPGINGGTLNPRLKLGVNCYGIKPKKNIINECSDVKANLDKKLKQIREDLEINKFNSNKLSQHS